MNNPLVSIIIPTYNRAHLIAETLDSVLGQTYENWECIIVDDGSTDDTDEVLGIYVTKDSRFQYHHRPKTRPKGANACRNYGFEFSKGEYINWFDSDDIMMPNFLKEHLLILVNEKVEVSICRFSVFNGKIENVVYNSKREIKGGEEGFLQDYVSGNLNINTPAVTWSRLTVAKFSYDVTLSRAQELKFIFDILSSQKVKCQLSDDVLVLVRSHEQSITAKFEEKIASVLLSEIKVRREILYYAKINNWENYYFIKVLQLYCNPLNDLFLNHPIHYTLREIRFLAPVFKDKINWTKWEAKFFGLLILYKLTKRNYKLNKHFRVLQNISLS